MKRNRRESFVGFQFVYYARPILFNFPCIHQRWTSVEANIWNPSSTQANYCCFHRWKFTWHHGFLVHRMSLCFRISQAVCFPWIDFQKLLLDSYGLINIQGDLPSAKCATNDFPSYLCCFTFSVVKLLCGPTRIWKQRVAIYFRCMTNLGQDDLV